MITVYDFTCPTCAAKPGATCMSNHAYKPGNKERRYPVGPHRARRRERTEFLKIKP